MQIALILNVGDADALTACMVAAFPHLVTDCTKITRASAVTRSHNRRKDPNDHVNQMEGAYKIVLQHIVMYFADVCHQTYPLCVMAVSSLSCNRGRRCLTTLSQTDLTGMSQVYGRQSSVP